MTGRIVRSVDFQRVLRLPPRAKSVHFAVHHMPASPARFVRRAVAVQPGNAVEAVAAARLSTAPAPGAPAPVDEAPGALWLGTVVPKRHARRSVTRSLMKRQMHAAFDREPSLPRGLWVLRLRSGFDVRQFPSAASDLLKRSVRDELDALLAGLAQRLRSAERAA